MRLKFNNIGKVSSAEVEIDSITVIAGINDTGKSTAGKLLYSISTALNLLERMNQSAGKEVKYSVIQDLLLTEFSGSLTSEVTVNQSSTILMEEDNGDSIFLELLNNEIKMSSSKINISREFSKSFYIDDPFILDEPRIGTSLLPYSLDGEMYYEFKHRLNLIREINKDHRERNYFDEKLQNQKMNEILSSVIGGNIRRGSNSYQYHADKFVEPLNIESISAGMKSFSIIKMLIESGYFNNSEFLILDEPEIHLHPEWQLKYAELIVLISKNYPIRILITSHSPYFIEAIELYSKLHKVSEGVRYYKAQSFSKGLSTITDISNNIADLYEDMAIPFRTLDELREDLDG